MPDPHRLITQLELSVHTYWRLYKADLLTVARIVEQTPEELLEVLGRQRARLDELRSALVLAGYDDPWPELDGIREVVASPSVRGLSLPPAIEEALQHNGLRTIGRVLATPGDDLLDFLNWEQFEVLKQRLIELGHSEPGNIEPSA